MSSGSDEGEFRKAQGMARGNTHANPAWLRVASTAVLHCAKTMSHFSADDVHPHIDPNITTHDKRALGSVMRDAAMTGIIEKARRMPVMSIRPNQHRAPIQVWKSLVYKGSDSHD